MPNYPGAGTPCQPYVVSFSPSDPTNPYNWQRSYKWLVTAQLALATWTVSFSSSSYSGGLSSTEADLKISEELAVLGVSLYVLGFAVGPLVFAPLSEMVGRRPVAIWTLALHTPFHVLVPLGGKVKWLANIQTLLAVRLLTGIFGSSPLTNAGATIADIWGPKERGMAAAIYSAVPFLGPIIGPIVGSFASQSLGWRFTFWLMFIFGAISLTTALFVPETYGPVLLRQRAEQLTKCSKTGDVYVSVYDSKEGKKKQAGGTIMQMLNVLKRPFVLIVSEPLLVLLTLYISIVYGTLYALFEVVPGAFRSSDSTSSATTLSSLAFLGLGIGILLGLLFSFVIGERMYHHAVAKAVGDIESKSNKPVVLPEARLPTAVIGTFLLPIGLFWFAFSSSSHASPVILTLSLLPFGIGISQLLQSTTAYLMDAYGIWFASASAGIGVFKSITGAAFPLCSAPLFARLGDKGTMLVFTGLCVLVGVPVILGVWKYGKWLRWRSKYAYKEPTEQANHLQTYATVKLPRVPLPARATYPSRQERPATSASLATMMSTTATVCGIEEKDYFKTDDEPVKRD